MLITPEILTIYILDFIFVVFATIAFYFALKITIKYDPSATTNEQYRLEKQSYLSATIIKFIFYIKVPLFAFFIFTLDKLSNILPGAMCAAGVVNATSFGTYLLIFKILNIYMFAFWLVLHQEDMKYEDQRLLRSKFLLYIVIYVMLLLEIFTEIYMFFKIDVNSVVDCCGAIFSTVDATYMAKILSTPTNILLLVFYGNFILMVVSYFLRLKYLFSLLNIFFVLTSLVSLIAFFGTYIYELPTHHCPFCMLQKDYDYIGYILYICLFLGTFFGSVVGFIEFSDKDEIQKGRISLFLNLLYLLIVSYYPIMFYIRNGVFM